MPRKYFGPECRAKVDEERKARRSQRARPGVWTVESFVAELAREELRLEQVASDG